MFWQADDTGRAEAGALVHRIAGGEYARRSARKLSYPPAATKTHHLGLTHRIETISLWIELTFTYTY